jgi:hypothetical protein
MPENGKTMATRATSRTKPDLHGVYLNDHLAWVMCSLQDPKTHKHQIPRNPWVCQAEVDTGQRPGTTSGESAEIRKLRAEVEERRRADEILKAASAFFAAGLDRRAPGCVRGRADLSRAEPARRADRTGHVLCCDVQATLGAGGRDAQLSTEIARVRKDNREVYGAGKVWLELNRG